MFLNTVMLAGIAGAAVPLILHLLNRARYRNVAWGAMMFLQGGDARRRQSIRLRQWIILALRMAVVALLAVALARPVAAGRLGALGPNANVTAVILLDHSGSMGYGRPGQTRMDQAREAVRQIIATLRRGDEAALITLGDFSRGPAPRPTADLQSIIDSLDNPQFQSGGAGATNIADGLKLAADLFERQSNRNRALFIVCDRQALNWRNLTEPMAQAWRQRVAATGPPPRFIVVPVGGWESDNVAIEAVSVASPQIVVNQPADIQITVHNYGPAPRPALPLSLWVDGRWISDTTVNLPPAASATAIQSLRMRIVGSHVVTVHTQLDGIGADEQFPLAVDVVRPVDVLVVRDGQPVAGPADYLTLALMPFAAAGRAGADPAAVRLLTWSAGDDWTNLDSRRFRVIVLDGISHLTPAQARALEQHVYGGGGAAGFAGRADQHRQFQRPAVSRRRRAFARRPGSTRRRRRLRRHFHPGHRFVASDLQLSAWAARSHPQRDHRALFPCYSPSDGCTGSGQLRLGQRDVDRRKFRARAGSADHYAVGWNLEHAAAGQFLSAYGAEHGQVPGRPAQPQPGAR